MQTGADKYKLWTRLDQIEQRTARCSYNGLQFHVSQSDVIFGSGGDKTLVGTVANNGVIISDDV